MVDEIVAGLASGFRQPPVMVTVTALADRIRALEAAVQHAKDILVKGDLMCEVAAANILDQALK